MPDLRPATALRDDIAHAPNPDCQQEIETSKMQCMHKWAASFFFFFAVASFADEPKSLAPCNFQAGVEFFQKSQFDEAKNEFQNCLTAPQYRASALYNLGNVAFRQQKLGLTLAYYRRFLAHFPFNKEARHNLQVAWNVLKIKSIPGPVSTYETLRNQFLSLFSADVALGAVLITLLLCGRTALKYARRRAEARNQEDEHPAIPGSLFVFSALLVVTLIICSLKIYDSTVARATVIASKVDVKSGPGEANPTLFEVPEGLELLILDSHDGWFQVMYPGGLTGWVPETSVMQTAGNGPW